MNKLKSISIALLILTVGIFAQSQSSPKKIDWRYTLTWDNPNTMVVTNWTVYASNTVGVAVRMSQTRTLNMDLKALLNGAPAGTYALFATATSDLGDISEFSTNIYVWWPGGDGKVKPGINPNVDR